MNKEAQKRWGDMNKEARKTVRAIYQFPLSKRERDGIVETRPYIIRIVDAEEEGPDNVMCFGPYTEVEARRLVGLCNKVDTHGVEVEIELEPLFQDPVGYTKEIGKPEDKD